MKTIMVRAGAVLLALVLLGGAIARAQSNPPTAMPAGETLTIQVDVDGVGHRLIGTYVVRRVNDGSGLASWTFKGMLDGELRQASGMARERWAADGSVQIELTEINGPGMSLDRLPIRQVTLSPQQQGLMMIAGVPLAVRGAYKAPGAGSSSLIVMTDAGRGTQPITALPNTSAPAVHSKGGR